MIVLLFVFSCKTRYVPVEIKTTETVEVHDTTITERLVPYKDSTATRDTVSFLSNPYAYSWARYSGGILQHSLGIWPNSVLIVTVPHYMTVTKRIEVPKIVEVEKKIKLVAKNKNRDRWMVYDNEYIAYIYDDCQMVKKKRRCP